MRAPTTTPPSTMGGRPASVTAAPPKYVPALDGDDGGVPPGVCEYERTTVGTGVLVPLHDVDGVDDTVTPIDAGGGVVLGVVDGVGVMDGEIVGVGVIDGVTDRDAAALADGNTATTDDAVEEAV